MPGKYLFVYVCHVLVVKMCLFSSQCVLILIDCKRKRRKIEDGYTIISNASTSDLMTK